MSHLCEVAATLFVVYLTNQHSTTHVTCDIAGECEVLLGEVHACICAHEATELRFIAEFHTYMCPQ